MTNSFPKINKLKSNSLFTSLQQVLNRFQQINKRDARTFLTDEDADMCNTKNLINPFGEFKCRVETGSQIKRKELSNSIGELLDTFLAMDANNNIIVNTLQSDLKRFHRKRRDELDELNSKHFQNYNSVVTERDGLWEQNAELNLANKSLQNEKASLVASKQTLENEKDELRAALAEAQDCGSNSDNKVFPFVDWGNANPSNAWYKDIDWSTIPFNRLSEDEIKGLDWSKINYTQAQSSGSFNIIALDWDQINGLSDKLKNKVYNNIDWGNIKFNNINPGDSNVFDWSFIDMKNIPSSPGFTLDVVEIDEINGTKSFNQLCKVLKKESSLSNGYLAGASDKTLQEIGYENFVGKITDKKMQEFTTNNGDKYTLVMKPLSYERAYAVSKAMGGRLATIDGNESNSFVDKLTGILDQKSVINSLSQTEVNDVSAAWFGYSATDNPRAYTPIRLAELASSGVEDLAIADSTKSLWFIVETEAVTTISSTNFL